MAARAATGGSEHGAVGGAAGLGPVRHASKKKGALPLFFPPAVVAIGEDDHAVVGQRQRPAPLVPVDLRGPEPDSLAFSDRCTVTLAPHGELRGRGVVRDEPHLLDVWR